MLLRALLLVFVIAALSGCGQAPPPLESGGVCSATLNTHGVTFEPVMMSGGDPRCHVAEPVKVSQIEAPFSRPVVMSCLLADRFALFEHSAAQKLAMQTLGHYIVRIDHLGAYACRASTGHRDRLSEHAYGLAIDISGFQLSDGTLVNVERDWSQPGPKSAFLHEVARAACGYFSVVLTPDSNADHFNHMHFDLGPDRLCSV
ncbi:MAG TPA: extensin family protein [Stellaceae bacterium]|nr:extensin family protein [Stellaceae bacterium]